MGTEEVLKAIGDAIGAVVSFLEAATPELWRIAINQSIVVGVQEGIRAAVCLICMFWFRGYVVRFGKRARDEGSDWNWTVYIVMFIATVIAFLSAGHFIITLAGRLINPEYYAVFILLDLFK